jgi:methionine--tRNA ligase beta chain
MITFDDFAKLDIRIGEIITAERVAGTDKLLKLTVNVGSETRQLVAGIAESYAPDSIVGKRIPVVVNLEPKTIRGIESQGMILCPSTADGKPVLLLPDREVPAGVKVK